MTLPLGAGNKGRKITYKYNAAGEQTGTEVEPVTVTSSTTLESATASDTTKFYFDDNKIL